MCRGGAPCAESELKTDREWSVYHHVNPSVEVLTALLTRFSTSWMPSHASSMQLGGDAQVEHMAATTVKALLILVGSLSTMTVALERLNLCIGPNMLVNHSLSASGLTIA